MIASMIETMNEQQVRLANCIREYDLSHETDLRVNLSELNVNLCENGASSLTLESELVEVLDHPLTTLPLVAPSPPSILKDYTPLCTTYPGLPFPLTQSMEFEIGEIFCVDANVNKDDICCASDDAFIEVHDLNETLVRRLCMDVVIAVSPSPDLIDHVSPDPLDIFHVSLCLLSSLSPEYCDLSPIDSLAVLKGNVVDCSKSLGTFKEYASSLDPYSLYLENVPGKIMFIISFDHSTDFSRHLINIEEHLL